MQYGRKSERRKETQSRARRGSEPVFFGNFVSNSRGERKSKAKRGGRSRMQERRSVGGRSRMRKKSGGAPRWGRAERPRRVTDGPHSGRRGMGGRERLRTAASGRPRPDGKAEPRSSCGRGAPRRPDEETSSRSPGELGPSPCKKKAAVLAAFFRSLLPGYFLLSSASCGNMGV